MIDIICWKWKPVKGFRTEFTAYHVNVLYSMLKRHTTIPFKLTCITDDPEGINPEVNIFPLWDDCKDMLNPSNSKKPSCYRRLKAFSKDFPFDKVISIDLDCVIVGNIDDILTRKEDFVCLEGTARKTPYNGGLWSLKVGSRPQVWETFDPEQSPKLTKQHGLVGSDQGWISYVLGPKEPKFCNEDGVYCFRADFVNKNRINLPENAKIVMFQGNEDPWELHIKKKYPWVNCHYKTDNEKPTFFEPEKQYVTCITFLWGKAPYNYEYVNKLFSMIDRHLTIPHKNICFTDQPEGINVETRPLTTRDFHKNLKKVVQFDPNNGLTGRILSFDLDNVIIGSLDEYAKNKSEFIICEAVNPKRKGKCGGNFMAFDAGYGNYIWEALNKNYNYYKRKTKGFERFLYDMLIKKMDFWPQDEIVSYRRHVKTGKVNDWSIVKMIWCHGQIYLPDMKDKIIIDNWK